jgi:23S rRNA-/tRNA-specific pseudouridylate synthase
MEDTILTTEKANDNDVNKKLFTFCRERFKTFSKREIQEFFVDGKIKINGKYARKGHDDETRRVELNDIVEIVFNKYEIETKNINKIGLEILYECNDFAIIIKDSGISCSANSDYDKAFRKLLWSGSNKETCHLLYHLG